MIGLELTIPDDFDFASLKLTRDPVTLDVEFEVDPIVEILEASRVDPWEQLELEGQLSAILIGLYSVHLERGGAPDPVAEQVLAEFEAQDELGEERVQGGSGAIQ